MLVKVQRADKPLERAFLMGSGRSWCAAKYAEAVFALNEKFSLAQPINKSSAPATNVIFLIALTFHPFPRIRRSFYRTFDGLQATFFNFIVIALEIRLIVSYNHDNSNRTLVLYDQHAVAIAEEAVTLMHGLMVGCHDPLATG